MASIFIQQYFTSPKQQRAARRYVRKLWPDATRIQRVNGGFMVHETATDWEIHKRQN